MQTGNLIGTETRLATKLSPSEKAIVLASRSKRISEIEERETALTVTDLVSSLYFTLGQRAEKEDKLLLTQQIVQDLYKRFPNYTIEEVKNVFYLGSRGEFKTKPDEILFPTIEKINGWLKSYRETLRKEAIGKQLRFEQDNVPEKVLSESEKLKIEISNTVKLLEGSKTESGEFVILETQSSAIYNTLDKLKLIPFTVLRKKEFYQQAEEQFRKRHSIGKDLKEVQFNKRLIAALNDNDSYAQNQVKSLAKHIALKEYLTSCVEMGEDVIQLIQEAKNDPVHRP